MFVLLTWTWHAPRRHSEKPPLAADATWTALRCHGCAGGACNSHSVRTQLGSAYTWMASLPYALEHVSGDWHHCLRRTSKTCTRIGHHSPRLPFGATGLIFHGQRKCGHLFWTGQYLSAAHHCLPPSRSTRRLCHSRRDQKLRWNREKLASTNGNRSEMMCKSIPRVTLCFVYSYTSQVSILNIAWGEVTKPFRVSFWYPKN